MAYLAVIRAVPNHDRLAHEGVALAGFETFVPKIRTRVGAQWRTTPLLDQRAIARFSRPIFCAFVPFGLSSLGETPGSST